MENVDRSCSQCVDFLQRRYGVVLHSAVAANVDVDRLKPKEPEGPTCVILFSWAITCLVGGCLVATGSSYILGLLGNLLMGVGCACAVLGFIWLPSFVSSNIIGYPMHVFCDGLARVHMHLDEPMRIPNTDHRIACGLRFVTVRPDMKKLSEIAALPEAAGELVSGPILKLRVGGWFRRTCVIGSAWDIERCWNGLADLRIHDWQGGEIGFSKKADIKYLFGVMNTYSTVDDVMTDANRIKQEEVAAKTARVAAERERDHLGIAIMATIARMTRDRKTLGASKHAQRLREHFAQALEDLPSGYRGPLIEAWTDRAIKILAAEETDKAIAAVPLTAPVEAKSASTSEVGGTATT